MSEKLEAARALLRRVVKERYADFEIEIAELDDRETFEIQSRNNKILLRGNTPVTVASALNWYLKYYCHCHISWNGDNLKLPESLPQLEVPVRRSTRFNRRVYLNYCTFSYSMPWWHWQRWEREIDWMAMHGVNTPLAITGLEAVWMTTLKAFGLTDEQIREYLTGPTYMAWQWMGNLESWGGPLPQNWIDQHLVLAQKILERQRSLGMTPVLQGFSGCVPSQLAEYFPEARIQQGEWLFNFKMALLDPLDPLFEKIASVFYQKQKELFGTDHLYACDPFHEISPPEKNESYLERAGEAIYKSMVSHDPKAVMAIQTWTLREGLVRRVPEDRSLMLSITGTNWKKYNSYNGRPWIVGALHNFGGRTYMGADLQHFAAHALSLVDNPQAGNVEGIGVFPEGIEHNPVVYELLTEIAWLQASPDLGDWIRSYAHARYGNLPDRTAEAWEILSKTVYNQRKVKIISMESPVCARPALDIKRVSLNGDMVRDYSMPALWDAWSLLLGDANLFRNSETFEYDLVDLSRQCLADLSLFLHQEISDAYKERDHSLLSELSGLFLDLLDDLDELLATRREFLLGKWVNEARSWGADEDQRDLFEQNARRILTVWGTAAPNALLFDYAHRQWSGLLKGFYKVRWEKFFNYLLAQPEDEQKRYREKRLKKSYDRPSNTANQFFEELAAWEEVWVMQHHHEPDKPSGDAFEVSARLYRKWLSVKTHHMHLALENQKADDIQRVVNTEETIARLVEELPEKNADI